MKERKLKDCSKTDADYWSSEADGIKTYCPDWDDDDFLFGDYFS